MNFSKREILRCYRNIGGFLIIEIDFLTSGSNFYFNFKKTFSFKIFFNLIRLTEYKLHN